MLIPPDTGGYRRESLQLLSLPVTVEDKIAFDVEDLAIDDNCG
jgi:hypothetical protein